MIYEVTQSALSKSRLYLDAKNQNYLLLCEPSFVD